MADLTYEQRSLLEWLSEEDGQYGECHGATLDALVELGLAKVLGPQSGVHNSFIAKGTGLMYRAVRITPAGRKALRADAESV